MSIYDIEVKDIDMNPIKMEEFKGKTLLIVNVASACGFTPQYTGLQNLYDRYKDKGLEILAFPCNQFGAQEPGSDAEILEFAQSKYQANFPVFSKIDVNGTQACDLYNILKRERADEEGNTDIPWNFAKFLVDGNGQVVGRFSPQTAPEELKEIILEAIEASG